MNLWIQYDDMISDDKQIYNIPAVHASNGDGRTVELVIWEVLNSNRILLKLNNPHNYLSFFSCIGAVQLYT